MTKMKMLTGVIILSVAIAAPVFAQDAGVHGRGSRHRLEIQPGTNYHHVRPHDRSNFRGAYNQRNEPFDPDPQFQRNIENFGFSGRDPSRIGGEDPSLHPSQY